MNVVLRVYPSGNMWIALSGKNGLTIFRNFDGSWVEVSDSAEVDLFKKQLKILNAHSAAGIAAGGNGPRRNYPA